MTTIFVEIPPQLQAERQLAILLDERAGLNGLAMAGNQEAAARLRLLDEQIAGLRAELRERALDGLRAWAQTASIGDLVHRLDRAPSDAQREILAARVAEIETETPDARQVEGKRQRLERLREQRAEYASVAFMEGGPIGERARLRVAELDLQIAELVGVPAAPEPAKPVDKIDAAVAEVEAELAKIAGQRGPLALKALHGDADAAAELAELEKFEEALKATIRHAASAREEQERCAAARDAKEQAADQKRAAELADLRAEERDEAFGDVADACDRLLPVVIRAVQAERAAAAALIDAGRPVPKLASIPVRVVLCKLEDAGLRVRDADVPLAAERLKLLEEYANRPRSEPRCTCCSHPERAALEAAVAGASQTEVASKFGVSRQSVQRHVAGHMGAV
jgi:hypothetical protein